MSGRGTGDEYTPHRGDPWHPDWAADKEAVDDDFVTEAEGQDEVEPESRRGLFGRRRKRQQADAESVANDEPDEAQDYDEVDVSGSSVAAYEALRDDELDEDVEAADDDAGRVAGTSGIDLSIAAVAAEAIKELDTDTLEAIEVVETFEQETVEEPEPAPETIEVAEIIEPEAVVEEPQPAPEAIKVAETFEPEAIEVADTFEPEAIVEEPQPAPEAIEVAETFEPEAIVEEPEPAPEAIEVAETFEPEAIVEEPEPAPEAIEVADTFEPEAIVEEPEPAPEAIEVEEISEEPEPAPEAIEVAETFEPEAVEIAETFEEVIPEVAETIELEEISEEVEPAPEAIEVAETIELEETFEEVEPAPEAIEVAETIELEEISEEPEPAPETIEVAETFEPEAVEIAETFEEVIPEVAETIELEEISEEVEPAPEAIEVAETIELEEISEEVEEEPEPAPETIEVAETIELEEISEEVEEEPEPAPETIEVAETIELEEISEEVEAAAETFEPEAIVEEAVTPEVAETFEPEEIIEAEPAVEVAETFEQETGQEPELADVTETLEPEAAVEEELTETEVAVPSAVESLIDETVPGPVQISAVESLMGVEEPTASEAAAVVEPAPEVESGEEIGEEAADEESPGPRRFGGATSEIAAGSALGGAAASDVAELPVEDVLDEQVPKVGWWRRTFGSSTPEPEEPADPMAGVVEDDSDLEAWPEYQEAEDADRADVAFTIEEELGTAPDSEATDLAIEEEAAPKGRWWRRNKQEEPESESTISGALERSEGEPGSEGWAMTGAAAGALDADPEVDTEADIDAAGSVEADHELAAEAADIETEDAAVDDTAVAPELAPEAEVDHVDEWVAYTGVAGEEVDEAQSPEEPEPKLTRRQRRKAEKAAAAALAAEAADIETEDAAVDDTAVAPELAPEAGVDHVDDVDEWVAYTGVAGEEVDEAQSPEEPEPKLTRRQRRKAEKAAAAALAAEAADIETEDAAVDDTAVAPELAPEAGVDHVDDVDEWVAYTGVAGEEVDEAQSPEEPEPKLTRRQRRKAEKAAAAALAAEAADIETEDAAVDDAAVAPELASEAGVDDVDEWVAYAGVAGEEVDEAQPPEEPEPKLTRRQRRKAEKAAAAAAAALAAAEEATAVGEPELETAVGSSDEATDAESDSFFEEGPGGGDDLTEEQYVSASTREHVGLAAAVAAETGEDDQVQAVAASMPGVESGVVGFGDVVDSAEAEEAEAVRQVDQRDLAVRVVTGVALAGLALGAVLWGPWAVGVLVVVVMLIALSEFYGVLLRNGHQPLAIFGIIGGFIALVGTAVSGAVAIPGALIVTSIVMFFFYALEPERTAPLTNSSLTLMGMAWVTGFSAFAMTILDAPDFRALIISAVVLTVLMDTASYFSGRSWGRRKLAPVLSPNKTVEGLIGGVVVVLLTGAIIGSTVEPFDLQAGLALAAVVAAVAPLGDLAMSVFKRTLGVKDMGVILPGHGGILDRIDALLFVIPAAWATFHALGYLA